MKTYLSCSLAGLALLLNTAHAGGGLEGFGVPSNMDFYGGGSIGSSSEDGACDAVNGTTSCEDSSTGYKIFAGARLAPTVNQNTLPTLGVEGGYINFGESSAEGVILSDRGFVIDNSSSESETSAAYLAAVGYLPVAPRTELLGKAGITYWSQDGKITSATGETPSTTSSESGIGTLLGVGAQYQINDNLSVRGEYEQAFGIGKDTSFATEPKMMSVGAVFSTL